MKYEYAYDYIVSILEGAASTYWPMIGYLLITLLVFKVLQLLALRYVSHIKR